MSDKLLSSASDIAIGEPREYNPIESYLPRNAVYIRILGIDDPVRKNIPDNMPNPDILYVMCDIQGNPVGISDDQQYLVDRASENNKILYLLH